MKIKKKRKTHILSILMTITMLAAVLSGCSRTSISENTDADAQSGVISLENGDGSTQNLQASNEADGPTAMGRYIENVTDMSEKTTGYMSRLFMLSDGTIVLTDGEHNSFYVSKDNGETWEEDDFAWHKKLMDENDYIAHSAIGADGTAAIIYENGEDLNDGAWDPSLIVFKPDGTEILVETPSDAMYAQDVVVTDDGRVFVSFLGGSDGLYEVMDDGKCDVFLSALNRRPQLMTTKGNLLIIEGHDYGTPKIYDLEKDEYIVDEVFEDFMSETYPKGNNFGTDYYQVYYFIGEDGVLYIAGEKGLHRHVIGGSAIEQVVDGNLSTFSNPTYSIGGMIMLPDNEFMAIFSGGRLVHYVYDKDIPTVPNERLKVYSLKDVDTIRQAISLYQTNNPEVYVEYEVGIEDNSSVTRDDALKSLNTKIMAGEGPDVLVLDRMPLDSYIEKGLLLDMTSFISGLSGEEELFGNIVDAMKTDGKIYAMPCEIQVPVIMSDAKYLSMAKDLTGLADMMEEMRKDNPGKELLGTVSEKGVMRFFSMTSVPAWTTDKGEINKEAVTEYLKQSKRIYDAILDGVPKERIDRYLESNGSWLEEFGESRDDSRYLRNLTGGILYAGDWYKMEAGALYSHDSYSNMTSVNKVSGYEDSVWQLMNGQCENVFCAQTLLGINAASQYTEQAQDFIKLCLGKETQAGMYNGLAVNKAAFDASFDISSNKTASESEDGSYIWESMSGEDGTLLDFIYYWPDEKQIAELKNCIESLNIAYIEDVVIEGAVYEEGGAYFRGEQSLEQAVDAIEKKVALYMAE
ncbi:MAG: extracellular solute-binding protein [Lachnospiraceae bacterium]|nr:extracellular solute-binding protein [Lachnospiraceae bacterium]